MHTLAPPSSNDWHQHCPLCGSEKLTNRYRVEQFTVARCRHCTMVFVRERMTNETLAPYYEAGKTDYIYEDAANTVNLNYYYKRLARIISRHINRGRILDVGCCGGQFLDVMGSSWERYGIELSPTYAAQARRKYADRVHQGTLDDYPATDGFFDAITMLDTLDHCPQPLEELRHVNRRLRQGGVAVIKVHNISCLWAKLAGRHFYAIIPPFHLFYFDKVTLTQALEASGFRVTATKFIGHRLALKTVPYRLSQGNPTSAFFKLYSLLSKTPLGSIPIYKNFFDIITVVATKVREL